MTSSLARSFSPPLSLAQRLALSTLIALPALAATDVARAACTGPQAAILWTYPQEETDAVPPDAVFWAVSHVGTVSVEVDGVALTPRGRGDIERHQFTAVAPLADGEHELLARVTRGGQADAGDGGLVEMDERRVRFRVAAPPRAAKVSVESVTVYPLVLGRSGGPANPPAAEFDNDCSQLAIPLSWECNDIIPQALARITYQSEGDAIAYLVQGNYLLSPACPSFWTASGVDPDPGRFRAATVSPGGVTEEQAFAGPVEIRTLEESRPDLFARPSRHWCSIGVGQQGPDALTGAALAAVVAGLARRLRRGSA